MSGVWIICEELVNFGSRLKFVSRTSIMYFRFKNCAEKYDKTESVI